ncbi:hypothetical protein IQ272_19780 [Chroococcidiopsidales cyanobacterium LEGE 13417]|nr:hypothetical protein [Chroococcidiopsidales cyanobacterium LEGE 13417]
MKRVGCRVWGSQCGAEVARSRTSSPAVEATGVVGCSDRLVVAFNF